MWDREIGKLDTSPPLDTPLSTVPPFKSGLLDGAGVPSGGTERLHHDGTVPSQLQVALALFEADLPLTETQRALVRAALGTAGGWDATPCPRVRA